MMTVGRVLAISMPLLLRTGTTLGTAVALTGFTVVMGAGSMARSTRFRRGPLEYALRPPRRAIRNRA